MAERGQNLFSIDGEGTTVHVDDVREEARPRPFLSGVGSEGARTSVPWAWRGMLVSSLLVHLLTPSGTS